MRPFWGLFSWEDECLGRSTRVGENPREEQNGVLARAREGGLVGIIDQLGAEKRLIVVPWVLLQAELASGVNEDNRLVDDDLRALSSAKYPRRLYTSQLSLGPRFANLECPRTRYW